MQDVKYLGGSPEETKSQVQLLVDNNELAAALLKRYPAAHDIGTVKALHQYVVQWSHVGDAVICTNCMRSHCTSRPTLHALPMPPPRSPPSPQSVQI
jgi:hypothetical protein